LQIHVAHRALEHTGVSAHKDAALESLGPEAKTGAIPIEQLQVVAAAVDEDVQAARQRILLKNVLHERVESREGFPHVNGALVQIHAYVPVGEEHQPRRSRSATPPPSSSSTSQSDVEAIAGSSMKPEASAVRSRRSLRCQ